MSASSSARTPGLRAARPLVALGFACALAAQAGCDTAAFCFDKCDDGSGGTSSGTAQGGGDSTSGVTVTGGGGDDQSVTISVGSGPCTPTNPTEICDGIDNDCNGQVDEGIDFTDPRQCGTCANNCFTKLLNADPESITCDPGSSPGTEPGTCDGDCATDYIDRDGDGSCETFCVKTADDDAVCNNKDDDCDGEVDEDVDKCVDAANCGACGRNCAAANAAPHCVTEAEPDEECTDSNTQCVIQAGDCDAGFIDRDGLYSNGCEYPCVADGPEVCGDAVDNDCDGAIDGADSDLSGDPFVGEDCFGGQVPGGDPPDGLCGADGNEGQWECVGNELKCDGPNVVEPGDLQELCNGDDDDCNGLVDDSPSNVGAACGVSNFAPCRLGQQQCVEGTLTCVGAVDPGTEVCNGVDDDCDGVPDKANGQDPEDSVGACNVPIPPPPGAVSACSAGTLECVGGALNCDGDVLPTPGNLDTCGVDQNCDGNLSNQPDTDTDVRNCGACGVDCYEGSVNAIFACDNGDCDFQGCQAGFADPNGDGECELACTPTGPEVCDGLDNDCDGQTDEGVILPPPTQVCGISPSAVSPECTTGVAVSCFNGGIRCTFSNADVCPGGCSASDEKCDDLDNDCDGYIDENVPNAHKPCASDDGEPPPGDGACRRTGTVECVNDTTAVCNAVTANCTANPGGCTEKCDGIDNDCDGDVDEVRSDPGDNAAFYYKPEVVQIQAQSNPSVINRWIYAFEASRPNANATSPGSGNGYVDDAPIGTTRDATPACSESGKVPWFNVTPDEVAQTCDKMGGFVCEYQTQWKRACKVNPGRPNPGCTWGYNSSQPSTTPCTTAFTATKYCNIAPSFDFDGNSGNGDQDGLLPTGDLGGLNGGTNRNCWADWTGLNGNPGSDDSIYDITGNLREIVLDGTQYRVVGGAFNTQAESGATCDFDFYAVPEDFKFFDTGFRCCFDTDPSP